MGKWWEPFSLFCSLMILEGDWLDFIRDMIHKGN